MFLTILKQELSLTFKKPGDLFSPAIFFLIAISIFAISIGNVSVLEADFKQEINICVIWFCLIFSTLLGAAQFIRQDFEDGNIEQLFLSGKIFELIIASKIFANWLIYSVPLILVIPLAAIILKIDNNLISYLIIFALIVTLIVNIIACFCASLLLSANGGVSLLTILILPLIIPIIIFANSGLINLELFFSSLNFLIALLVFFYPILTIAAAGAVRINLR